MISELIRAQLRQYSYNVEPEIGLSGLLTQVERDEELVSEPREKYIAARMDEGNRIRKALRANDALVRLACAQIMRRRIELCESQTVQPVPETAWILRSLKHPQEVNALRQVYGPRFVCIAAQAPRQGRLDHLASDIAASHGSTDREAYKARAQDLAVRDEAEDLAYGQNVSETFVTADCFVEAIHRQEAQQQLERFFDAWFGQPYASPSRHEYAMFLAKGAAARSVDLSRQVGASIVTNGSVVALGCNEVPAFGGGSYWEGDPNDARDFMRGFDANARTRAIAVEEVRAKLAEAGWIANGERADAAGEFAEVLAGTRLDVLTEFGRPLHAEMSAILDAGQRGVALNGAWLYCTTFPCHNCAKHLVGAGFHRVYFIEPYPKSLAEELHEDSVLIDPSGDEEDRVRFLPFVGVSPNIYLLLYERSGNRKTESGAALGFDRPTARPKLVEGWDWTYLEREGALIIELEEQLDEAGERLVEGFALPEIEQVDE
jgi:cytidine deaminase